MSRMITRFINIVALVFLVGVISGSFREYVGVEESDARAQAATSTGGSNFESKIAVARVPVPSEKDKPGADEIVIPPDFEFVQMISADCYGARKYLLRDLRDRNLYVLSHWDMAQHSWSRDELKIRTQTPQDNIHEGEVLLPMGTTLESLVQEDCNGTLRFLVRDMFAPDVRVLLKRFPADREQPWRRDGLVVRMSHNKAH